MTDKKQSLLLAAAELFHTKGYHNVGIKEILDEVKIPKGSFYYYFASKDQLILEIIDLYINDTRTLIDSVDQTIEGLKMFFNVFFDRLRDMNLRKGCPVGNLILEISEEKEEFREKLQFWYNIIENRAEKILSDAGVQEPHDKACMLVTNFEGVMMMAKLTKKAIYFDQFNNLFFDAVIQYNQNIDQ